MSNELTTTDGRREAIRVLQNSLYPGAKAESVELVLSYCRMNNIDPFLRPVHIVPTNVKNKSGQWENRDVLMPGIADYRIKAARSKEYAGKTEPDFGPTKVETLDGRKVAYPEWCKVTIFRLVGGQPRSFTAREMWLENYATEKRDSLAPNKMWQKRPFGQLAKCAEAQALRMAFPEFSGGTNTAEEMEGKSVDTGGTVLEHEPEPEQPKPGNGKQTPEQWLEKIEPEIAQAAEAGSDALCALTNRKDMQYGLANLRGDNRRRLNLALHNAEMALHKATAAQAGQPEEATPKARATETAEDEFPGDAIAREEAAAAKATTTGNFAEEDGWTK